MINVFLLMNKEIDQVGNIEATKLYFTNFKKNIVIKDIVSYIKNVGLNKLLLEVKETDTRKSFYSNNNFDKKFWQSGNNYFIYNIKYQFREGVINYQNVNEYIEGINKPMLYSKTYYESLKPMPENEIKKMLIKNSIEIEDCAITSGKHRAFAMVGRIISNQPYIPFWAIIK